MLKTKCHSNIVVSLGLASIPGGFDFSSRRYSFKSRLFDERVFMAVPVTFCAFGSGLSTIFFTFLIGRSPS